MTEHGQARRRHQDGDEQPLRLAELPLAYRNTTLLLRGFDDLSRGQRDEICEAWAEPLRADGADITSVRVYAVVHSVRPDGPPPRRTLAYECAGRE